MARNNKNNRKNGGRKPQSNSRKPREASEVESKTNEPSWYNSSVVGTTAANLFFAKRFGSTYDDLVPQDFPTALGLTQTQSTRAVPGIQVLELVPSFGPTSEVDSPINIASQAIYSFVRHANSGSRNYDAPDLMTYLIGMGEAYSYLYWLRRIYGFANTWFPQNTYFPEHLLTSMHVDFSSVLGNMAQFAFGINVLINKVTAFAVPGNMDYFKRKAFLYQNVFIESDNIKDQVYMYNPLGFYFYTMDDTHPEAYLKYRPLPFGGGHQASWEELIAYGNEMIQNLLNSEDIGICSGDIIKAYGFDNLIRLEEMSPDFSMMPVVGDENIFYQIRNASIVSYYNVSDLHQNDSKSGLEYEPYVHMVAADLWEGRQLYLSCGNRLLTSNKIDPTSDDVFESTRLMTTCSNPRLEEGKIIADVCIGTEVCINVAIYTVRKNMNTGAQYLVKIDQTNQVLGALTNAGYFGAFKYHPTLLSFTNLQDRTQTQYNGVFQDVETVTTVDPDELENIHEAAMLSLLAVPAIGKLNTLSNVRR